MIKKPTMVVMAPYGTMSGYGAHSRDIIQALIESDRYTLYLVPMNWGNTPQNALKEDNPVHKKMLDLTLDKNFDGKPDYFVHISIPLEFRPFGVKNIGITAGIETSKVAPEWLEKTNAMDVMIVPSEHSKNVHAETVVPIQPRPDQPPIGEYRSMKPIEVLFEGVDLNIYKPLVLDATSDGKIQSDTLQEIHDIPEEFAFLYVGHWMDGKFREDRKDVGGLIYNFINTFNYKKGEVALVLKTTGGNFSRIDRTKIMKKIEEVRNMFPDRDKQPNIYLVHGSLTDAEMNELYNIPKIKAMVSLTHGEGYGRPLAEFAAATGKPVLAPFWSGHIDFLRPGTNALLFDYDMAQVPADAAWEKVIEKDSKWANVKDTDVVQKLTKCFYSYEDMLPHALKVQDHIINFKNLDNMKVKLIEILDRYAPPVKSDIILPGLTGGGALDLSKLQGFKKA